MSDASRASPEPASDEPLPGIRRLTRREFAVGAGTTALLPLVRRLPVPWPAPRPTGPTADGPRPHTGRPDGRRPAPQERDAPPPGTEALVDYVRARWGERLSEKQLGQIRETVADNLRAAGSIREVPLANADEPAPAFRAYRGGDRDAAQGGAG